jgi:hypothetical protein
VPLIRCQTWQPGWGSVEAALGIAQNVGNEAVRAGKRPQQAVALERQHQALLEGAAKLAEQATKAHRGAAAWS